MTTINEPKHQEAAFVDALKYGVYVYRYTPRSNYDRCDEEIHAAKWADAISSDTQWGMRREIAPINGWLSTIQAWFHDHADSVYAPSRYYRYDPISGTHDMYDHIRHYDAAIWSALLSRDNSKLRDAILHPII